nr:MAG TPA: hypothetical protein [Caudoviricetes sp.]
MKRITSRSPRAIISSLRLAPSRDKVKLLRGADNILPLRSLKMYF